MKQKSKYVYHSHITEKKFREIIKCFVIDIFSRIGCKVHKSQQEYDKQMLNEDDISDYLKRKMNIGSNSVEHIGFTTDR